MAFNRKQAFLIIKTTEYLDMTVLGGRCLPDQITTENGNNWTVLFFDCSTKTLGRILVDLFQCVKKIKEAKMPHFMIREFALTQRVGISLRILRNQASAEIVDNELVRFMKEKGLSYQLYPEQYKLHAWIQKDEENPKWDKKRCEALHRLSEFVVFLAQNSLFDANDKC